MTASPVNSASSSQIELTALPDVTLSALPDIELTTLPEEVDTTIELTPPNIQLPEINVSLPDIKLTAEKVKKNFAPVNRSLYCLACAIVGASVVTLSTFNHIYKNTNLGSKATISDDRVFLGNLCIVNWITHIFKGIWRDVSSYKEQGGVLLALPLFGFVCDLGAYFLNPSATQVIGPTTVLVSLISFSLFSKTIAKKTLGQVPFTQTDQEPRSPESLKIQKVLVHGLVVGVGAIAAVCDHVMSAATKPIVFSGFSGILSKIGKSLIKVTATQDEEKTAKKKRLFAVIGLASLVPVISVVIGLTFPWNLEKNPGFNRETNIAYHYLGAPTAIALSALSTNLMIRSWQKPKAHAKNYYKSISTKKRIVNTVGYMALTISTSIAHALNYGGNSAVSLAIKLCQMGWGFHMMRELMKGTSKKVGATILLSQVVFGAGVQAIANMVESDVREESISRLSTFAVTAGIASLFFAKMLRNQLLPKRIPANVGQESSKEEAAAIA